MAKRMMAGCFDHFDIKNLKIDHSTKLILHLTIIILINVEEGEKMTNS